MIRRNQNAIKALNAALDFILVVFSYLFSAWLRLRVLTLDIYNYAFTRRMVVVACIYALVLLTALGLGGFYSTTRIRRISWKIRTIFIALTLTILVATTLLFVFRQEDFSRGILVIFYLVTLVLLVGKYVLMRLLMDQLRAQGLNIKHQVVIGTGPLAKQYRHDIENEPELGIAIDAALDPTDPQLQEALTQPSVDEIVIALESEDFRHIEAMIEACERNGVKYLVIPFYNDLIPEKPVVESVGRTKLIHMRANRLEEIGWAALKRGFDIAVSAVALVALSPLLAVIAVGVRLSGPGPVLSRQTRVGKNLRSFSMLKFRTLRDGATTGFGAFLRRTSLDELPQLWNVLRGEMSLVGPRPELPQLVEKLRADIPLYTVKHRVKPGITGWAQVNGYRGDTSAARRIELDLWYIDNWSPWLDLSILARTVPGSMLNEDRLGEAPEADVKLIVAAHKSCWMPEDALYVPVQVGAANHPSLDIAHDDTGDNISARNAVYGELTGLYWAWKNLKADYLGMVQYRRYFTVRRGTGDRRDALTLDQARQLVWDADVILPKPVNDWIRTDHARAQHAADLDAARQIVAERHPDQLEVFDRVMKRAGGHRFNMFIMKRDALDRYCAWLFPMLFALEGRLDPARHSDRALSFVAERLLDVWLEAEGIGYREIPCVFLDRENWITRGAAFIKRRLEGDLISVIVPVYNAKAYLDKCVSSILRQDYSNLELILVDDGSTDGSGGMCDEWAKKDARVRVFHKQNGGQSSARNYGMDQARGQYIAFVDSDDWVSTDYLSYLLSLFPDGVECNFTACNHRIVRNDKPVDACDVGEPEKFLTREAAFEDVLFHGCMDVAPWGKLYRRSVFEGLRYPEGRLFEDTWLFGDILNRTEGVVFGNKPCYYYVVREGSTVNQAYREKNLEYIEAAEKLARDAAASEHGGAEEGLRRVNHARLSVLRYMENCEDKDKPTRDELRAQILADAPKYINDPRTPRRDKVAVALLRLGLKPFYHGWRIYSKLRH